MVERKELKDAFEHREKRGLLNAFSEEEDLLFMSEVDAAIHRKGSSMAFVLTIVIALLLVTFVLWAHFTVLDEVTRGLGQVIPSQKVQVIQNLEGGILQEIAEPRVTPQQRRRLALARVPRRRWRQRRSNASGNVNVVSGFAY